MIKKFLHLNFIIIFFIFITDSFAEDFYFEGEEIQVIGNGEILKSNKGIEISSTSGVVITAKEFEYNKKNSELSVSINVIVNDKTNNTLIKTNKIKYFRNLEKIETFGETEIEVEKNILIKTKNLIYLRNSGEVKSKYKTMVVDKYQNSFNTEDFLFNISNKILKGKNVNIKDKDGNISFFNSFYSNISKNEFYGKDIKIDFSNKSFGNALNEPRLYGNILESKNNITTVSKGIFTTCKKRDGCPPWTLKADKVIHNKRKKTINYLNAWLEVYDKPILYFPRFFHPDPTVKRQSGFLIPQLNDSGNTGTSIQIPYYKVIADNEDMTIKPRLFTNNDIVLQNEYRKVGKNYKHISDFSFYTSAFGDDNQTSKSHFFSNSKFNFEDGIFKEYNLELNFEQVANDTYLKKYKINSPLIKSETLMHSFLEFSGYNDDSSVTLSTEVYEDLTKRTSDRYEIIIPNLNYSKDLKKIFKLKGTLNFQSDFFQKQYETNKYDQILNNSIIYSSPKKFENNGLVKNLQLSFLNPNKSTKTGSNNESKSKSQLLSQFMYTLSYPLLKQSEYYNSFITPNISYRFSPNKTKNMSDKDRRLDISNINSFNRISENDAVEGGHSITASFGYKKNDKFGDEKISLEFAQVISDTANEDLPIKSSLNKKYSDLIGNLNFKVSDILKLNYDFMLDDGLSSSNYNSLKSTFSVNNLITTFEYLEESNIIGSSHYIGNETTLKLNNSNSLAFKTRSNREIDMTEFYNLMYQYENDCLRAALEYNKTFYADSDIKPEEELLFSLTIMPFSKISSTNLK